MAIVTCPQCGKAVSSKARKCPHCGFVLQSVTELRKLKRILIPIISVCVVAILAILFYIYSNNWFSSNRNQTKTIIEDRESTVNTNDVENIENSIEVEETVLNANLVPIVEEALPMETLNEETVTEDSIVQPQPMREQTQEKPVKPKASKLDLGYAIYEPLEGASGIKNGQPHGNGIMHFKSRQTIPGTVDCVAESGEWVNGAWRDGKINVGTWYRNDGNQVIVKLGQRYNK